MQRVRDEKDKRLDALPVVLPYTSARRTWLLVNLGCVAAAIIYLGLLSWTLDPAITDFDLYRRAALSLQATGDPYERSGGYIYPPLLAYIIQPLSAFGPRQAQVIWFWINCGLLAGLVAFSIVASASQVARRCWGIVAFAVVVAPPTRLSLQLGQVSILMAVLIVAAFTLARKSAPLAGTLLALASLIKIYPALLGAHYLLRRRFGVIGWTGLMSVVIALLSIMAYGLQPYISYLTNPFPAQYFPATAEFNISLFGFWQRLFTNGPYVIAVMHQPLLAYALIGGSYVLVLGAAVWTYARTVGARDDHTTFSAWLCGMLLLSPINGYYNLVLLLLPCLIMVRALEDRPDRGLRNWLLLATGITWIPPAWSTMLPWLNERVHTGWGNLALTPALYGLAGYLILCSLMARRTALADRQA